MYFWVIISLVVLALDQLTKLLVSANFSLTDHFTFIPYVIDLVYTQNTGAAFSIFQNHAWLLGAVSFLFSLAIVFYMLKTKPDDRFTVISAGLLLGGALGNGIDRIFRRYVVDFIEFAFFDFPVFNLADVAITVGAVILIIGIWLSERKSKTKEEK